MKIMIGLSLLILTLNSCNNTSYVLSGGINQVAPADAVTSPEGQPYFEKGIKELPEDAFTQPKRWTYESILDTSTGKTETTASLLSKNRLKLKSPDNGPNPGKLILKENHGVTYLIVAITKGKFNTDVDGGTIKVKFDQGEPESYVCTKSNDGQPTLLFVNNPENFIEKLKVAKLVRVEADIVQNGPQTLEFDVEGLKWK